MFMLKDNSFFNGLAVTAETEILNLVDCVHVERQFPFFNSLAVTAEAGKQFIAKSVTGDNVDGIYLKFVHRTKLLQD